MDTLLEDWGFSELIPVFQEQEIDADALLQIDLANCNFLESIIPKIGARIKFMAKLKNYQMIMKSEVLVINDYKQESGNEISILHNTIQSSKGTTFHQSIASPSTTSTSSVDDDDDTLVLDDVSNQIEIKEAFKRASKRQLAFVGEAQFKKACRNVYNLDLREFLENSVPGKYILYTYNKEKRLSRKTRNQLTSLLINVLISQDGAQNLIPTDFIILSEKITDLFPTESKSTYYIPRVPGTKKSKPVNAKGKLIDKYRNLCRTYLKTGDLLEDTVNDNGENSHINVDGELENSKLWLRTFQEPWDLVLEKWKSTFPLRKSDKSTTVDQFICDWPILKHREAYTLIDSDFKELYPKCLISLHNQQDLWDQFFEKFRNVSNVNNNTEEFLGLLLGNIGQDSKNAIKIAALSMLCPPKGRIKCGQKAYQWKPSILECQESMINLVPNCGNIQEFIKQRKTKLAGLKVTNQPYIIAIGPSFSEVTDSYLVVDDYFYRSYSVLHAFDFAFKSFHSLNAKYPKESEHIWLIIEKSLFKIESSGVHIPLVSTIVKDIELS